VIIDPISLSYFPGKEGEIPGYQPTGSGLYNSTMTLPFLLSHEIVLLLVPLVLFLLVAVIRATTRKTLPMSKVWLTIKVALFGILLAVALRSLDLPPEFGPYAQEILGLVIFFCLANLSAYLLSELYLQHRMKGHVPSFLRELLHLAVYLVFAMVALRVIFNLNMASILTTTTVITAAFAFAMQTTLSNLIVGFYIQGDKNFKRGTWVQVKDKDISGEIVNVGFRYTTLLTPEGHQVHIPNNYLTQNIMHTIGNRDDGPATATLKVQLDYGLSPDQAKKILRKTLQEHPGILPDPAPSVRIDEFMESGIQYSLRFYLEDYGTILKVRDGILRRVWYSVIREGESFPYPHRAIIKKETSPPFQMGVPAILSNLRRIEILNSLSDEDLDSLAQRVNLRVFGDGETVVRQGEGGDSLFIVLCGALDVYIDGNKVGGLAGSDFFGEMSLLTGENRRATVAATDEVWLMEISKSAVEPILRAHPSVLESLSRALERRAETNWAAQQSRKASAEAPTRSDVFLKKIKSFFGIS